MTKNNKSRVRVQARPAKKSVKAAKQVTALGTLLRTLGGIGGGALGGMIGRPISGNAVGTGLGASLSKWLGAGDYTVSSNSIVNSLKASGNIPMMHQNDQTVIVRHKEYLTEVSGNSTFLVRNSFPINPGMAPTFPWLSRIANNYQQYRIRGMVYHYVPTSGSATGTNTSLGSVMLQTSYRSTDTSPSTKIELLNEYWASESVPSEPFAHPVECNPNENPFNVQYVRGSAVPSGENQLMYDLGVTHLAVSGQQSTAVIGDLWVTYEVELKKPIIASNVTTGAYRISQFQQLLPSPAVFGTHAGVGDIGLGTDGYTISLPSGSLGTFHLFGRLTGPFTGACAWAGGAVLVNCVAVNIDGTNGRWETTAATAPSHMVFACAVLKLDQSLVATVTFPTATIGGGSLAASQLVVINDHSL